MIRRLLPPLVGWTAIALCAVAPLHAERDHPGAAPATPQQNFSDIHDSVEWVDRAFREAQRAAEKNDWTLAVHKLQTVVEAVADRERPSNAAPYVRSVRGRTVYEGAWLVAHHTLVRYGAPCLSAYKTEFGTQAQEELERALREGRSDGLVALARQYLVLPSGRRAALLLSDMALERGQYDEALEWLELLEDLEAVSTEPKATLDKWRNARLARHARALADPEEHETVHAALTRRAQRRDEPDHGLEALPFTGRARAARPTHWATTGGNAARSAVPPSLGSDFKLAWYRSARAHGDLADSQDPADKGARQPSTWLPPRSIVMPAGVFVSDGVHLNLYDLQKGRPLARRRFTDATDVGHDVDGDRRTRFGWLEGHSLTGIVDAEGTTWIYATVPDGRRFEGTQANETPRPRDDRLEALAWDGQSLKARWVAGGLSNSKGMPDDVRLYGAPVHYRERLWIAGMRPSGTSSDRWEAWLFALNPSTGAVVLRTHIGTGTPIRPTRQDEVIPTSPAASRGRVVVSTSLGIVAAMDARDGRVRWAYRNDRDIKSARRFRGRQSPQDQMPRDSSFANEPPVLAGERCYVAPTDGQNLYILFNRPIGRERMLESQKLHQKESFSNFQAEAIAGVVAHPKDGSPLIVVVGQGENRTTPPPVVVTRTVWPPRFRWSAPTSTGLGAYTFGRALVTQGEVFVPTRAGIQVYDLATGKERALLDLEDVPEAVRPDLPRPYGNLVPVPGKGIVAVSTTSISYWKRAK